MDKKTLRNDIILIASLLLIAVVSLIVVLTTKSTHNLEAKIYVKNELVETIDLDKAEDTSFPIKGSHGDVIVTIKDHKIAITESNCPHQDCVHMGYVAESNKPIICAYNEVYIVIDGNVTNDVEIG